MAAHDTLHLLFGDLTPGERERYRRRHRMAVTPLEQAEAALFEARKNLDLCRAEMHAADDWSRSQAPVWIANAERRLADAERTMRELIPMARAAE